MRVVLFSLIVLAAICAASTAQCPDGTCPQPQWQPSRPAVVARPMPAVVRAATRHDPAVVRINVFANNDIFTGSGVIVSRGNGLARVLTSWHNIGVPREENPGAAIRVDVETVQKRWGAKLLGHSAEDDLACLEILDPGIEPIPLASAEAQVGESVLACGWGSGMGTVHYTARNGVVTSRSGTVRHVSTAPVPTIEFTGVAVQGDSGGPVLNCHRQLVGVCWGSDGQVSSAVPLGRIGAFLRRVRPGVIVPKRPLVPVRPSPPATTRPPVPGQRPADPQRPPASQPGELLDIIARLEKLEAAFANFQVEPGPPGKDGEPGPPGPRGERGPAGAPCDMSAVLARLEGIEAKLNKPITAQIIRDGKVIEEEEVYLGGTLPLRLVPTGITR